MAVRSYQSWRNWEISNRGYVVALPSIERQVVLGQRRLITAAIGQLKRAGMIVVSQHGAIKTLQLAHDRPVNGAHAIRSHKKYQLVADLIREGKSLRAIVAVAHVSPTTVTNVRRDLNSKR